jgi:3'(2'), 5'-bisphosphate nucleotidase
LFQAYQKEAETALQAVRLAVDLARPIQRQARLLSAEKDDLSPVTVADYTCQAVVCKVLGDHFPRDAVVAEEGSEALRAPQGEGILGSVLKHIREVMPGADEAKVCDWIDHGTGQPAARFWVLDPVDGTKGFLRGDQYAIALALIEEGKVVLGVMGCPNLDPGLQPGSRGEGIMVAAVRGGGAWTVSMEGRLGERLQVSGNEQPAAARVLRSVESDHTDETKLARLIEALGIRPPAVRMDSQAKHAVLAAGAAELIIRLNSPLNPGRSESIWDHAPGAILVEEAGGRVTDLRGAKLDFTAGRLLERNYGVLVSNARLHEAVLKGIAAVGADNPPEAV